jgi:hypothetical protein
MYKLSLLFFFSLLISSTTFAQDEHIGTWHATDDGKLGYVKFAEDGYAWFIVDDKPIGGPSFQLDSVECNLTYTIDYSVNPHRVDFVVKDNDTQDVVEYLKGIFVYQINQTQMWLCLDYTGKGRPAKFVDKDTVILDKLD